MSFNLPFAPILDRARYRPLITFSALFTYPVARTLPWSGAINARPAAPSTGFRVRWEQAIRLTIDGR